MTPTAAGRIGQDLHVHPMLLVLAGVEGAARGDAVNRQQGAVQQHERLVDAVRARFRESRGERGQELDGLGDVPVGRRGADAETGCELGVRMAVAKVREGEQSLPARAQTPPPGAELPAVLAEPGQEAKGRAGHVDAGRIDKHTTPLVEMVLLGRKPIYQELHLSDSPTHILSRQVGKGSSPGSDGRRPGTSRLALIRGWVRDAGVVW